MWGFAPLGWKSKVSFVQRGRKASARLPRYQNHPRTVVQVLRYKKAEG